MQPKRRRRPRRAHPPSPTAGKHIVLPDDLCKWSDIDWGLDPSFSKNVPDTKRAGRVPDKNQTLG